MKKLYLCVMFLMTVAVVLGQKQWQPLKGGKSMESHFLKAPTRGVVVKENTFDQFNRTNAAPVDENAAGPLITATPAGTYYKDMYRSTTGYAVFNGRFFDTYDDGFVNDMVVADDGTVYLKNPVSTITTNSWLKGTPIGGDTILFKLPQLIYTVTDDVTGEVSNYYAQSLTVMENGSGLVNETKNYAKFVWRNDTLRKVDPTVLGMTNAQGKWQGYGDIESRMFPVGAEKYAPQNPSSAKDYALSYLTSPTDTALTMVKVALEGDNLYIGGLQSTVKDGWIKGTVKDKKVYFPTQYMGVDTIMKGHLFFYPAQIDFEPTANGDYLQTYELYGGMNVDYNTDSGELSTAGGIFINLGNVYEYEMKTYPHISLKPALAKADKPMKAEIKSYEEYYPGYGALKVNIVPKSVDGSVIEPANLYYKIYINGQPYTFTQDLYNKLPQKEMDELPYSFADNYNIYVNNDLHTIFFYVSGIKDIGVEVVNKFGNQTIVSDMATYSTSGISETVTDEKVDKISTYYDLNGRQVKALTPGVYVKRQVAANGRVKTVKVVVK